MSHALIVVGFILGLGPITVIDFVGFLGRTSPYWNETAIRVHKVTKRLTWAGFSIIVLGHLLGDYPWYHFLILGLIFLNALFLSFYVSPELLRREKDGRSQELLPLSFQHKVLPSFLLSLVLWWGLLFLVLM